MAVGWDAFIRAMDGFEGVLQCVPNDRWASPSPCEGWSARDVAGHLIVEIHWGADLIVGNERLVTSSLESELKSDEPPIGAWKSARSRLEDVCTPERLQRSVHWPFGDKSVDGGLGLFSLEVLVHTWDIGRAGGLDVTLDRDLVHDHFARLERIGHLLRGPGMYGPQLPAPPEASEQNRLMAFLGRDPDA
jgi:uncharacterized protein (TIGR03086 family)